MSESPQKDLRGTDENLPCKLVNRDHIPDGDKLKIWRAYRGTEAGCREILISYRRVGL